MLFMLKGLEMEDPPEFRSVVSGVDMFVSCCVLAKCKDAKI